MKLDEAVYKRLSGYSALTALVSTRIRPGGRAPQNDAYPHVVFHVLSDLPYHAMSADATPHRARVQVSVFAENMPSAVSVDLQVRAALNRFRGTAGTVTVQDIFEDGVQDFDNPEVGTGVFQRARDFIVFYEA